MSPVKAKTSVVSAYPTHHDTGPIYLVWTAVDEMLRRSREKAARERDRWRAEWADICRGDGEVTWRKRASARLRARQLLRD